MSGTIDDIRRATYDHENHVYIDSERPDWLECLEYWVNYQASDGDPCKLIVTQRQTAGTIYCDRVFRRVVMHPHDRAKMLREVPPPWMTDPVHWFA